MRLFESLKRRRIIPWIGAYLAGGFLALEGVDQLVGYELVSALVYRVVLVLYVFGIPSTIVLAWFHGEKGQQELERKEIGLQSVLVVAAILATVFVVRSYRLAEATRIDVAAEIGLDPNGVAVLYFEDLDGEYGFVADGLTEAQVAMRAEKLRPAETVSRGSLDKQRDRIERCLDTLEARAAELDGPLDLAQVAAGVALRLSGLARLARRFPSRPAPADGVVRKFRRPPDDARNPAPGDAGGRARRPGLSPVECRADSL